MDCFVVMPYGVRPDSSGRMIDFDAVYKDIIEKAVKPVRKMSCTRCDHIEEPGPIHHKMFGRIYEADVAIVDITSLNPNVFYELGVRHVLAEAVTVIIKRSGTEPPFNINGLNIIEYDDRDEATRKKAVKKITSFIRNGIDKKKVDSPVYHTLKLKTFVEEKPIEHTDTFTFNLKANVTKKIGCVTGDLQDMENVADVWVNSENTNMEMARHYDRSISGMIRFLGAKKDPEGHSVIDDIVANKLAAAKGGHLSVPPAAVIVTEAGELEHTHGVKKIFHVASVIGQVGKGYSPIPGIEQCVYNALQRVDAEFKSGDPVSILFPLMGTGTGRGSLDEMTPKLLGKAISYLHTHPATRVGKVLFVTRTQRELDACLRVLRGTSELTAG